MNTRTRLKRERSESSSVLASLANRARLIQLSTISLAAVSFWVLGCTHSEERTQSVEMESPRISSGTMIEEAEDDGLKKIAMALDGLDSPAMTPDVLEAMYRQSDFLTYQDRSDQLSVMSNRETESNTEESPRELEKQDPVTLPAESGKLISLERMSPSEIHDLLRSISLRFQTEHGYHLASPDEAALLGEFPAGVSAGPVIARVNEDESTSLMRFSFVRYLSQLPQLWSQGVVLSIDGVMKSNPELEKIQPMVENSVSQVAQMRTSLTQNDLERKIIQLSYVDTKGALNALKGLGIQTIPVVESLPATIDFAQLPMVTALPSPSAEQTGLVGDSNSSQGAFGQTTTPTKASSLNADVNAGRTSQLIVIFHPAHPEQFSMVRSILDEYIDRPARQVFIEGLVLEISEDGLDELGVEWSYEQGAADLVIGSLDPTGLLDSIDFSNLDSRNVASDWGVKIRALLTEGKAEILSRPSILTMNNRQATIRVGEDIPIATSQEGVLNNSNKVAFNFKYLPTGILLNIRPRLSEQGDEVSMLIDTVVSARVPGRDLEIRSTNGDLLATAPTISTRRVQTYARIENKTPFIIGGLVSHDETVAKDKVPLLGDLPLIGHAFRSESTSTQKREVIIVLTPYVLPEDKPITRALPKDDSLFDNYGNKLFRDAYRIRGEDVFDLRFLAENKRLMIYRKLAHELIKNNFVFADTYPFNEFANDTIPGEEILIQRMIYEVIKRTNVGERVNAQRIIFFEEKDYEGYNVRFLNYALSKLGDGITAESFFERNTGKAVAFTYTYSRNSLEQDSLGREPIPEIALVDCPDRDTWQQLLWDMNQPSADGIEKFTILIHSPSDILRLQRALMLKFMIELNGGIESLSLNNFSIGKILHTPNIDPDSVSVIDADVARYFFHTELYYAAIIKRIEETLKDFDKAAANPGVRMYLDSESGIPSNVLSE